MHALVQDAWLPAAIAARLDFLSNAPGEPDQGFGSLRLLVLTPRCLQGPGQAVRYSGLLGLPHGRRRRVAKFPVALSPELAQLRPAAVLSRWHGLRPQGAAARLTHLRLPRLELFSVLPAIWQPCRSAGQTLSCCPRGLVSVLGVSHQALMAAPQQSLQVQTRPAKSRLSPAKLHLLHSSFSAACQLAGIAALTADACASGQGAGRGEGGVGLQPAAGPAHACAACPAGAASPHPEAPGPQLHRACHSCHGCQQAGRVPALLGQGALRRGMLGSAAGSWVQLPTLWSVVLAACKGAVGPAKC